MIDVQKLEELRQELVDKLLATVCVDLGWNSKF
jgi:hypothetical protein